MQNLDELKSSIAAIREEILKGAEHLGNSKEVYEFKKSFLDPKMGKISQLMKGMKDIPGDQQMYLLM